MKVTPAAVPDVLLIEPKVFGDTRGFFFESFNQAVFAAHIKQPSVKPYTFVQDNHSCQGYGVLLCLHYQVPTPQGKLFSVGRGLGFDAVLFSPLTSHP